ncbi:ribosome-inactivating family protein [Streptomyces lavenduligriseus]|uniref:Ribosome-inactivating family protein n=1 Tax=Streptomyces lavenduligriseus TaxID=67315 RepID=A0ABT0P5J7_9ACTN|nr:ribosome-inactivating family protein [Streptomyces lavenduligriseus]MCL3998999.1 ribosome-inactivating family protein [Streptomyces lavenduligriseus]
MLKRLLSILLSLSISLGLVTLLSGTASATNYQIIDWHVSRITDGGREHERRYYNLIADIHRYTYGLPTHYDGLTQTTTEQGRLIQVRVLDTDDRHLVSVYLWADNLYVAGFYAPATNRHFSFNDRPAQFMNALGINSVGLVGSGNYGDLAGGNDRHALVLGPETMYHAMQVLGRANGDNDEVEHALVVAIQVFSEAARFSPILDRVRDNIENWHRTPLGNDYAGLENQWGAISRFAYNIRQNPNASIRILNQVITSLVGLAQVLHFVELHGSEARLG